MTISAAGKLPAHLASRKLKTSIENQFSRAESWLPDRDGTPPRTAIAGAAGLGKTTATLESIASPAWKNRRTLFLVPTLDLADELAIKARSMGIPTLVIRGRSQPDPTTTGQAKMCVKSDMADAVAALSGSVSQSLCYKKATEIGKEDLQCPFYTTCSYIRQEREAKNFRGLLIASHNYLHIPMDILSEKKLDMVIIDESFWQTLLKKSNVLIDRFLNFRAPGAKGYTSKSRKLQAELDRDQEADAYEFRCIQEKVEAAIRPLLKTKTPLRIGDLTRAGLTAADCKFATAIEYSRLSDLDVHPGMSEELQRQKIAAATDREVFKFARVWKLFAAEIESGRDEFYSLDLLHDTPNQKTGLRENVLSMQWSDEARFQNVPLLIIDADADRQILDRFYPGIEVEKIDAQIGSNVNIRQVADRTGSMTAFRNQANQDRAFNAALNISDFCHDQFADDPSARPLVVVQKQVRDAWLETGKLERAPFEIEHFGNLRGKDGWKHTCALTIFGRIEPSPAELESMARAIWYRQPETFEFLPIDEAGRVPALPRTAARLTDRAGTHAEVMTGYHPDPRINSVLLQIREAEVHQAIARARLIFRDPARPCIVTICTNVPLAIEVDELTTWDDIIPDRFDQMRLRGFIPDVSVDCAAAYPDLFSTPAAVRKARERAGVEVPSECVTLSNMTLLNRLCHTFGMVRVEFRIQGNRKRRGGFLRLAPGETEVEAAGRIAAILPGISNFAIVGDLPALCHDEDQAASMAEDLDAQVVEIEAEGLDVWWRPLPRRTWSIARSLYKPSTPRAVIFHPPD